MPELIQSPRLQFSLLEMADADEVFKCITPAITTFMPWEPPVSFSEYKAQLEKRLRAKKPYDFSFVIRLRNNMECVGLASLEDTHTASPELGLWLKETAQRHGYGRETVEAIAQWACSTLGKEGFIYPVAVQNMRSRRIAEAFHGEIIGTRTNPKYDSVVYKIPWKA